MECICIRDCTIRLNDKSIYFNKDQIVELPECPKQHFQALREVKVDFDSATLELLLRSKNWTTKDAMDYLKKEHKKEITGPPLTRREMAALVIDTRDRKVTLPNEE